MQTIERDIYVTKNVLQAPIEITEGTNSIALEFDIKDYTIPGTAAAVVYSMCTSTMAEPNKALAEVDGNTITIIPCDINNLEKIYVTFKQGKYEFEKSMDQLNTSDETLFIKLSQDETLQLDAMKNVLIQVRAKTKDENVIASNIKSVPVEDILKEGMI